MREERGHWYLLTGFVIGIVLGLVYAWLISPQQYQDTSPASLLPEFKGQYRAMIASAFVATGNLPRAEARLALLGDGNVERALTEQAQRTLGEGNYPLEAQALGLLAVALGQGDAGALPTLVPSATPTESQSSSASQSANTEPTSTEITLEDTTPDFSTTPSPLPAKQTPQVTRTALSTATPLPTRTPTVTPGSPFVLQSNTFVCDTNLPNPLIQVIAEDSPGEPLPGQEIITTWEGGEDYYFTGLKPELGLGYADFLMTPGVVYQVRMAGGGQTVPDITPAECETQGGRRYWGSWLLVFSRP
ncbi:MAG: hypothetical protein V3U36_01645 [Anaerolineales bacterium]